MVDNKKALNIGFVVSTVGTYLILFFVESLDPRRHLGSLEGGPTPSDVSGDRRV